MIKNLLKASAVLLDYPTERTVAALPALREALAHRDDLEPLFAMLEGDLYDAQEAYVETFDRGRRTSLNLFEHVHGESRDRGQAMVDLLNVYESAGLKLSVNQLPDYLPVFLEYAALLDVDSARAHLQEVGPIIAEIAAALDRRQSPFAALVALLIDEAQITAVAPDDDEEDDLAAIDAEWEAAPAFGGCTPAPMPSEQPIHLVRRAA